MIGLTIDVIYCKHNALGGFMNKKTQIIKPLICILIFISIIVLLLVGCLNNYNYLKYEINSNGKTYTVVGYKGPENASVVIPETYRGRTVTAIADNAFKNATITSITLHSTIGSIGTGAFSGCTSLKAVYGLEKCDSLKQIREETFFICRSLEYICLPPNITIIGDKAFVECVALKNIGLPSGLQFIGFGAFGGCESLEEIIFPNSVIEIGPAAFALCNSLKEFTVPPFMSTATGDICVGCDNLVNIYAPENSLNFSSIDGVLYDKYHRYIHLYPSGRQNDSFTIPEGVTHITATAFGYSNYLKEINIPKSIKFISNKIIYESKKLEIINYSGTVEEWKSINKDPAWDANSADYTIYCTDGQIAKDGTVTYK